MKRTNYTTITCKHIDALAIQFLKREICLCLFCFPPQTQQGLKEKLSSGISITTKLI